MASKTGEKAFFLFFFWVFWRILSLPPFPPVWCLSLWLTFHPYSSAFWQSFRDLDHFESQGARHYTNRSEMTVHVSQELHTLIKEVAWKFSDVHNGLLLYSCLEPLRYCFCIPHTKYKHVNISDMRKKYFSQTYYTIASLALLIQHTC